MTESDTVDPQPIQADQIVVVALLLAFIAALVIGIEYDQPGLAWAVGGSACAVGLVGWRLAPGSLLSRLLLASALMLTVALHIQLGRGTIEFHFGVFVTLGVLLVYLDWRPIVFAALLIAVHHLAADRLQALGWAVYCAPSPDFLKVTMHAAYVVAQTVVEVLMALSMNKLALKARMSAAGLKFVLEQLRAALATACASAADIETASREIAGGNADLGQRTEQTAGQLQRATDSMDRLTSTVKDSAESAASANRLAISRSAAVQSDGIASVQDAVSELERMTRQNASMVEKSAAATDSLRTQAQRLSAAMMSLKSG